MPEVKVFLNIYAEQTPNPETMKFVFNKMILPDKAADFPSRERAEEAPLAKGLFEFSFVNGVFIMNNFVTITRQPGVEWDQIIPILKEYLKAYIEAGEPIVYEKHEVHETAGSGNIIVAQIIEILDT